MFIVAIVADQSLLISEDATVDSIATGTGTGLSRGSER